MSEERLSDVICDMIALYESGKNATAEMKARLFDRIPEIAQRAIRPEDRVRLGGDPPILGQTSWIDSEVA